MSTTNRKEVIEKIQDKPQHWVGDGFPVRSLFSYSSHLKTLDPFLLLDHAGPAEFSPTTKQRGVDIHPHKGFETVTIVYKGEVEHKDSSGNGGVIGVDEAQWMTAGSGILHEEYHSKEFAKKGGELEMVQLWVNLPKSDKLAKPGYQALSKASIPELDLANGMGKIRVIAGEFDKNKGAASTFSPMQLLDIRLNAKAKVDIALNENWNTGVMVIKGTVMLNESELFREGEFAVLSNKGDGINIEANNDALLLILSGEPLNEPVVGYGPFVMNTQEEINEAVKAFKQGEFA